VSVIAEAGWDQVVRRASPKISTASEISAAEALIGGIQRTT
jgi:hypothetical protein